jgi:hypothetical protein
MAEAKATAKALTVPVFGKLVELNVVTSELALAESIGEDLKMVRRALLLLWEDNKVVKHPEQEHEPKANKYYDRWALPEICTEGITFAMYIRAKNDEKLQSMSVAIGTRLSLTMAADYRTKFKGNEEVLVQLKMTPQEWVAAVRRCFDDAAVKGDIEL